jgi:hypothetical protein
VSEGKFASSFGVGERCFAWYSLRSIGAFSSDYELTFPNSSCLTSSGLAAYHQCLSTLPGNA